MIYTLLAQIDNPIAKNLSPKTGSQGVQLFGSLLQSIIGILLTLGAIAFFFYFILGAIRWILSGGDKGQVENARNQITHAVVGLLILFALFAIITLIETVFDVCILFIDLGPLQVANPSVSNASCGFYPPIPGPGPAPGGGGSPLGN